MNLGQKTIFVPLLAQVALTFLVWIFMYYERITLMRRKRIDPERLKLAGAEADELLREADQSSDNFVNLFEVPVLFFVAVLTIYVAGLTDAMHVNLAWAFVVLRAIHSLIHCTYNRVMHRFTFYALSTLTLIGIWVKIATQILSGA